MNSTSIPIFCIRDILRIKRENSQINTNNKSCYVITCRISGESLFFYNNKKTLVKSGDILYIPYGASYSQKCEKEELVCIHLEGYSSLPDEINIYKPIDAHYVCSLFKKCSDEWQNRNKNYQYHCMSILYEILSQTNLTSIIYKQKENPSFSIAKEYLDSHIFDNDFSISALCEKTNMSRTYFNKLFKGNFEQSPIEYINKSRIEKAKFLLKSGNYTNEEIALSCGFNDVKYFYVVFKKITGLTTKDYINSL